jgi:LuxR family transcriptional regulator, activator of conjugal transfer of Ti plasmids
MLPHDNMERGPLPGGTGETEATPPSGECASASFTVQTPSTLLEAAMKGGSEHLCALVEEVKRFGSMEELSRTLARIILQLQFDSFLFLLARYPHRGGEGGSLPLLLSNYPSRWAERYIGERRYLNDPALAKGELHRAPFAWVREESAPAQAARTNGADAGTEATEHGLTVPIHGPRGELAFFAVGSRRSEQPGEGGRSSEILLQLVAFHAYAALLERVAKNAAGDSFGLTEHERQCLHWTARGKTTWETATILKRSTATINFHLRKACRKLGAANKCEAAARAAYHGLLAM